MTEEFDAKRARANRPMPLWVDAFSRKTALLSTDETGAYIKILMAMWSARDAALPNDPHKLARAAGVSLRLWNSRIGPALEGFWITCDEGITQKRLREEAEFTEAHCKAQSDRKKTAVDEKSRTYAKPTGDNKPNGNVGQKSGKALKTLEGSPTTDATTDEPRIQPTQLPNYPTEEEPPLAPQGGREKEIINFSRKQRTRSRAQQAMAEAKEILKNMEAQRNADNQ